MDDTTWLKLVGYLDAIAPDAIEHDNDKLARALLGCYAAIGKPTSGSACETLDAWLAARRQDTPAANRFDKAYVLLNPMLQSARVMALDTSMSMPWVNQERNKVRVRNNLPTNFGAVRGKSNAVAPPLEPASGFTYAEVLSAANPSDPWLDDTFYMFRAWAWGRRCYAGMLERAGLDACPYVPNVTVGSLIHRNVADDDPAYLHLASRYINRRTSEYMCLPIPAYGYVNASKAPNADRIRPGAGNSLSNGGRGITKIQLRAEVEKRAVHYVRDAETHRYIRGWDDFHEGEA